MCHPEVPEGQEQPEVHREEVQVAGMPAQLTLPDGGRGPGVLVICDVFGRSAFYENLGTRLATAGFTALVPEYFHRHGPLAENTREAAMARRGRLDQRQTLVELNDAVKWLEEHATGVRVGTVGFCMGGTLALDLAARDEGLATVCYYGFPAGGAHTGPLSAPAPLDEVDRMRGPILGFWGDQDAGVGMENVQRLAQALAERGVDFEHHVYPGLGHGFMARSGLEPGHEAYERACESWTRTLDFYRQHLGG